MKYFIDGRVPVETKEMSLFMIALNSSSESGLEEVKAEIKQLDKNKIIHFYDLLYPGKSSNVLLNLLFDSFQEQHGLNYVTTVMLIQRCADNYKHGLIEKNDMEDKISFLVGGFDSRCDLNLAAEIHDLFNRAGIITPDVITTPNDEKLDKAFKRHLDYFLPVETLPLNKFLSIADVFRIYEMPNALESFVLHTKLSGDMSRVTRIVDELYSRSCMTESYVKTLISVVGKDQFLDICSLSVLRSTSGHSLKVLSDVLGESVIINQDLISSLEQTLSENHIPGFLKVISDKRYDIKSHKILNEFIVGNIDRLYSCRHIDKIRGGVIKVAISCGHAKKIIDQEVNRWRGFLNDFEVVDHSSYSPSEVVNKISHISSSSKFEKNLYHEYLEVISTLRSIGVKNFREFLPDLSELVISDYRNDFDCGLNDVEVMRLYPKMKVVYLEDGLGL